MKKVRKIQRMYNNDKFHRVMSEYKHNKLRSGSKHGHLVSNRKQAIAIAFAESRRRQHRKHGK